MAHYYEELWKKYEAEIDQSIENGLLKPEDRQKAIAYYRQWFNWPGWNMLIFKGKTYYRDFGSMLWARAILFFLWIVCLGVIFTNGWIIYNLL